MASHTIRRALVTGAIISTVLAAAVPASARTTLQGYRDDRRAVNRAIASLRDRRVDTGLDLRRVVARSTQRLRHMPGPGATANPARFAHVRRALRQERRAALHRIERSRRSVARHVDALQTRRRSIDAWLDTWGLFEVCPVGGWHSIADNFGITVRLPGVPVHRHQGNDILAYAGTPIVAPFDGVASASSSELGGLEVRVTGARGYVYNAHLSSVGALGQVTAGTVVGYVGATGDATTAHDHLEWHPGGGPAVDPYPYLSVSCDGS